MDARLHPERAFGLEIGDAHVIRNAGGRVSDDASRSLIMPFRDLDESVREDVRRIRSSPFVPDATDVRGFVYDVHTGLLREVAVDTEAAA